jgi:hypothetical protein
MTNGSLVHVLSTVLFLHPLIMHHPKAHSVVLNFRFLHITLLGVLVITGDAHVDKMLEWATNRKFKVNRITYSKMKTMGKKAIDQNIPGSVLSRKFTEKADGSQRLIFIYPSLYGANKQLAINSRNAGK